MRMGNAQGDVLRGALLAAALLLQVGCSSRGDDGQGDTPGGGRTSGTIGGAGEGRGGGHIVIGVGGTGGPGGPGRGGAISCDGDECVVGCGNGRIDPGLDEACDDGNALPGDGCAADCKSIERDFGCLEPGAACISLVKCGDGKLMGAETCDDGNARAGDGCSAQCAVEDGWECFLAGSACVAKCGDGRLIGNEKCDPPNVGAGCSADCRLEPGYACELPPPNSTTLNPSRCHQTACGDSTAEGSEACDDGNVIDGDGCSGSCTLEPKCKGGTCVSICGDGIKLAPEECDDGNLSAGDGCSQVCTAESGFACADAASSPPQGLNLAVTYRDFVSFPSGGAARHPDFEADLEGGNVTPELVRAALGVDGLPELDGRCSDVEPATIADATLCPFGQMATTAANFSTWYRDSAGVNRSIPGALLLSRTGNGVYEFDSGNDGFYPIDDRGFVTAPASEVTALADRVVNDGLPHNFGFTTELRYFFQYLGGETLAFSGDDDLWVFINGRLALDVGGLHPRTARTLDVNASAATLRLAVGGVYEIALFHAERHSAGSNFRLTLTGFAPLHSTCAPMCGDGIVAASEQCDLGRDLNNGNYNGCTADCKRGPTCGDAKVQRPEEVCDDGLNVTPYVKDGAAGCAPGCVPAARCGDGVLDSLFGEECDTGGAPGGGCSAACRLDARCGDGVVQPELGEECDDGNTLSGDSCTFACRNPVR